MIPGESQHFANYSSISVGMALEKVNVLPFLLGNICSYLHYDGMNNIIYIYTEPVLLADIVN